MRFKAQKVGLSWIFLKSLEFQKKLSTVKFLFKVVIITNLRQRQKTASNAENITDLPQTLQVPSLCCFS